MTSSIKRIGLIAALAMFAGCSLIQTITPKRAHSKAASFDRTTPVQYAEKRNSGVLMFQRGDGGRVVGAIVTAGFMDYAQWLVEAYGDQMAPPMKDVPGVSPFVDPWGNRLFSVPADTFDRLRLMARWKRNNRPQTGAIKKLIDAL